MKSMVVRHIERLAEFDAEKMGKLSLASGDHLYAGLNSFLPGQEHAAHVHADQDKLYFVLGGSGDAQVGDETHQVRRGDLILAPAGIPHGLKNSGLEPLVVLVVFAPPPRKS